MLNPITTNEKVAALFQGDATTTAPAGKPATANKDTLAKAEPKLDVAQARKDLEAKQASHAEAKKAQTEGNFSINLTENPWYNGCLKCEGGKLVSKDASLKLTNGQYESAPTTYMYVKSAIIEANKLIDGAKAAADKNVVDLQKAIDDLEGKIKAAEEAEESGYSFFGAVFYLPKLIGSGIANVASFIYDLICCRYGETEGNKGEVDEKKGTPEKK